MICRSALTSVCQSVRVGAGLLPPSLESSTLPLGADGFLLQEAIDMLAAGDACDCLQRRQFVKCGADDVFQMTGECVDCVSWGAEKR